MGQLENLIPGEKEKAQKAIDALPKAIGGFYSVQYRLDDFSDTPPGTFEGLACKVCRKWREFGHADDCPVKELEPNE